MEPLSRIRLSIATLLSAAGSYFLQINKQSISILPAFLESAETFPMLDSRSPVNVKGLENKQHLQAPKFLHIVIQLASVM
jgi:hypothetical protein